MEMQLQTLSSLQVTDDFFSSFFFFFLKVMFQQHGATVFLPEPVWSEAETSFSLPADGRKTEMYFFFLFF